MIAIFIYLFPLKREHAAHGLDDQLEVGPEVAPPHVDEVQLHPFVEADGVAVAARLPVAGDALLDGEALALARGVLCDLLGQRRARPHHGEIPQQHVHELGQLVDARLADDAAHARDARIVGHLEHGAGLLVLLGQLREAALGVRAHAAELVHTELPAVAADAGLREDDRALGVVHLDGDGHDEEEPREAHEHARAEDDVERALEDAVDPAARAQALRGEGRLGVEPLRRALDVLERVAAALGHDKLVPIHLPADSFHGAPSRPRACAPLRHHALRLRAGGLGQACHEPQAHAGSHLAAADLKAQVRNAAPAVDLGNHGLVPLEGPLGDHDLLARHHAVAHGDAAAPRLGEGAEPGLLLARERGVGAAHLEDAGELREPGEVARQAAGVVRDGEEVSREEGLLHGAELPAHLDLRLVVREEALLQHARRGHALDELRHALLGPACHLHHVPHAPRHLPGLSLVRT